VQAIQYDALIDMPKKELVEFESRMGYWKGKGDSKRFVPLTNFAMKFLKFVKASDMLPDYAGFIVKTRTLVESELWRGQ